MPRKYRPYIPKTIGDLKDKLSAILLDSPRFVDKTGYFPEKSIDTTFYAFNEGLNNLRGKLGEDLYDKFVEMSDRMRAYFEADPEETTGEARKGKDMVYDMEDLLRERFTRRKKT